MKFFAKLKPELVKFFSPIEQNYMLLRGLVGMQPFEMFEERKLFNIEDGHAPRWMPEALLMDDWGIERPSTNCHFLQWEKFSSDEFLFKETEVFIIMSHKGDKLVFSTGIEPDKKVCMYMGFSGSYKQLQEYMLKFKVTSEAVEEVILNEFKGLKKPLSRENQASLAIRLYEEGNPTLITKIVRCAFMQQSDYVFTPNEKRVIEYYKKHIDRYKIEMLESLKGMMHTSICSMK